MTNLIEIPGIKPLWAKTLGDPKICIAVLDGLVDQTHHCFEGANLRRLPTLVGGEAAPQGTMSTHGTHVASVIFGQHGSVVQGIAPQCRGLIIPVFSDDRLRLSQLDLSRAIEQAVNSGAHIINISGGQLTDLGEAEDWLEKAVNLCKSNNVLIVAAAGNDGCECLHVPAAVPSVLAVGAMNAQGQPIESSNWGKTYQNQGILASGENILGAKPGGGTVRMSGTSFATPIVSGVAALLLSLQLQRGEVPDPQKVRAAILNSALPCDLEETDEEQRCLMGKLNIPGAVKLIIKGGTMSERLEMVESSGCSCDATEVSDAAAGSKPEEIEESATAEVSNSKIANSTLAAAEVAPTEVVASSSVATSEVGATPTPSPVNASATIPPNRPSTSETSVMPKNTSSSSNFVTASQTAEPAGGGLVYALGILGYDFGTEARRDSFKQLMPNVRSDTLEPIRPGEELPDEVVAVPANPYDMRQMVKYLERNPSEAKSLIWTLNLELTPAYAIEPYGPFAANVYSEFQKILAGEVEKEDSENYIERFSIPAGLNGRTVKLFSGQVVPVIEPENERGIFSWNVDALCSTVRDMLTEETEAFSEDEEKELRDFMRNFLNRVYYDLLNLGQTSQDRALNFAATQAFQIGQVFAEQVKEKKELDSITVQKSPFCRPDSDCHDVILKFFDPEDTNKSKIVYRYSIDVSDLMPVNISPIRRWSVAY